MGTDEAQELMDELFRNNSPLPSQSPSNMLEERSRMAMMYHNERGEQRGPLRNETFYAESQRLVNPSHHLFNLSFSRNQSSGLAHFGSKYIRATDEETSFLRSRVQLATSKMQGWGE